MHLLVKPSGSKLWRLAYRFDDKQKTLVGGKYPNVGLADARAWRDNAKAQLAQGLDPRAVEIAEEEQARTAAQDTFEVLARAWLANARLHWSERYAELVVGRFEADVFPQIGHLPIAEVDRPTLRAALKIVEDRGAIEFARRISTAVNEPMNLLSSIG